MLALLMAGLQPAWAQDAKQTALDNMFAALKVAPNEQAAAALEAEIRESWLRQASPAVQLLLARARREMSENAPDDALDSYDAALDLEPNLLLGWDGRAQARRALGDYAGSVHDIEQELKLEPRSFLAFEQLGRLSEQRGDWKGALAAWSRVLALSPMTPGGVDHLHDVRRRALGEQL